MMTESTREQQVTHARTAALAAEVEEITGELQDLVQRSSDAQWQQATTSEQWPIGVVAHHVAEVAEFFTQVIGNAAEGIRSDGTFSADDVDQNNARHAAEFATVGKIDVIEALNERVPALVAQIRQLRDDQLDESAGVIAGFPLTIGQVVELGVIGHFREHVASVRAVVADPV